LSIYACTFVEEGYLEHNLPQIQEAVTTRKAIVVRLAGLFEIALLAEAYGAANRIEDGLSVLTEAIDCGQRTGEGFHLPELHRLKGALLLQQSSDNYTEAEICFHQALGVARHQQAKSLELRAAMSLARLWQQQGKQVEAHELLAPIYHWFTEGFDTADLQEAKALLDALA
jgi:predicted ATPase